MGTTKVDRDQLGAVKYRLEDARNNVNVAIDWLKSSKEALDGAPVNDEAGLPAVQPTAAPAVQGGQVTTLGPTYLGTFDTANEIASTFVGGYNGSMQTLTQTRDTLDDTIEGIQYMIDNFDKVEETNAAGITAILTDPPYEPGSD